MQEVLSLYHILTIGYEKLQELELLCSQLHITPRTLDFHRGDVDHHIGKREQLSYGRRVAEGFLRVADMPDYVILFPYEPEVRPGRSGCISLTVPVSTQRNKPQRSGRSPESATAIFI